MRFNEPKASIGMSGSRTDVLMLAASSKPMQRRLTEPTFLTSATFEAAKEVVLCLSPGHHPQISSQAEPSLAPEGAKGRLDNANDRAGRRGRQGNPHHAAAVLHRRLGGAGSYGMPDVPGLPQHRFFGIRYILSMLPACEWDVKLCGFSWEGWKRHAGWMNAAGSKRRWQAAVSAYLSDDTPINRRCAVQ